MLSEGTRIRILYYLTDETVDKVDLAIALTD